MSDRNLFTGIAGYEEPSDSDIDQANQATSGDSEIDTNPPKAEVDALLAEDGPNEVVENSPALQFGPNNDFVSQMSLDLVRNMQRLYETAISRKNPFSLVFFILKTTC